MVSELRMLHQWCHGHVTGHAIFLGNGAPTPDCRLTSVARQAFWIVGRHRLGQVVVRVVAGRALQPALAFVVATTEHKTLGGKTDGGPVRHDLAEVARRLSMASVAKPQLLGSLQLSWVSSAVSNLFSLCKGALVL